jgi:hypothetical protein
MYGGQRELPAEPTELAEPARASDRDDREQALLDDRLQLERRPTSDDGVGPFGLDAPVYDVPPGDELPV